MSQKELEIRRSEIRVEDGSDWWVAKTNTRRHNTHKVVFEAFNNRILIETETGATIGFIWDLEDGSRKKLIQAQKDGHNVLIKDDIA